MIRLFSLFIPLFFFITDSVVSFAQKPKSSEAEFDSLYVYISTRLSAENNDSAFIAAVSLLSKADNSLQKVKVLMLLATLYERKGDAIHAINYAHQAYQLCKKHNSKEWLLRINGFMSTTYRKVDLHKYGRKYLNEAINLSRELKNPLFQSFILQEKAMYSMDEKDYKQALDDLNESIQIIESTHQNANLSPFFWATNAQLLGLCYDNLGRLDEAEHQYKSALDSLNNIETELKGFCYAGLARVSLRQGKPDEAASLIGKAEKYNESSKNFQLQLNLAELYTEYYTLRGDSSKVLQSQRDLISIKEKQKNYTQEVINNIIDEADADIALTKTRSRQWILTSIGVTLAVLLGLLFFYVRRIRRQKKTYELIISKMMKDRQFLVNELAHTPPKLHLPFQTAMRPELPGDISGSIAAPDNNIEPDGIEQNAEGSSNDASGKGDNGAESIDNEGINNKNEDNKSWKKNIISEEYRKLLQEKLTEFEQGNFYLKPNLTLTTVASELKTNTKYLSVFISEYKGPDFNNYINRLRISYIIQKLHSDPSYREYKISYLAEECGFSSHAKFATVFKEILGISPSTFIRNLKK